MLCRIIKNCDAILCKPSGKIFIKIKSLTTENPKFHYQVVIVFCGGERVLLAL